MKKLIFILMLLLPTIGFGMVVAVVGTYSIINGSTDESDEMEFKFGENGVWFGSGQAENGEFGAQINSDTVITEQLYFRLISQTYGVMVSDTSVTPLDVNEFGATFAFDLVFTYEPPSMYIFTMTINSVTVNNSTEGVSDVVVRIVTNTGSFQNLTLTPYGVGYFGGATSIPDGNNCPISNNYVDRITVTYNSQSLVDETDRPITCSGFFGTAGILIPTLNFTYTPPQLLGDINFDNEINVTDVVNMVSMILQDEILTDEQLSISDMNQDNVLNVVDIVLLVDYILN